MARNKRFRAPKVSTVIGAATQVTGDLEFSGGLHLDGSIKGNVSGASDGQSTLTLSEQGRVEGDVRVDNLILNGTVVGDVYANERAELAADARVTGTVYYRLLEMAMGAEVNGQLVHTDEEEPRMLGFDGSGPPKAEPQETGAQRAGRQEAGPQDTGSQGAEAQNAGSQETGSQGAEPQKSRSPFET